MADGKFPSGRSLESDEAIEEERRLFYVAVTRAKDELYLTYPCLSFNAGLRRYAAAAVAFSRRKCRRSLSRIGKSAGVSESRTRSPKCRPRSFRSAASCLEIQPVLKRSALRGGHVAVEDFEHQDAERGAIDCARHALPVPAGRAAACRRERASFRRDSATSQISSWNQRFHFAPRAAAEHEARLRVVIPGIEIGVLALVFHGLASFRFRRAATPCLCEARRGRLSRRAGRGCRRR